VAHDGRGAVVEPGLAVMTMGDESMRSTPRNVRYRERTRPTLDLTDKVDAQKSQHVPTGV
jgi:hypothetical protein